MPHHLPHARAGQIVGLLGGSFDPPHEGHVHITREAIKRFGLGQVWWLVSPGNPLKAEGPADLDRRMRACRDLLDDSRVVVTD
ncbi:MAG: adenylyltransferase/cytidyltransferase family protein, partial [Pseudomonadota bacterium]|nr:adenylyltransferase/cytidyltransferase family protein [Pseudomonadota bacterium]